jgi:hypothetical protein
MRIIQAKKGREIMKTGDTCAPSPFNIKRVMGTISEPSQLYQIPFHLEFFRET